MKYVKWCFLFVHILIIQKNAHHVQSVQLVYCNSKWIRSRALEKTRIMQNRSNSNTSSLPIIMNRTNAQKPIQPSLRKKNSHNFNIKMLKNYLYQFFRLLIYMMIVSIPVILIFIWHFLLKKWLSKPTKISQAICFWPCN